MTKHTLGTWYAKEGQIYPIETGKTLALIPYFDEGNEEQQANQKLIAAAPKLLEALQEAMNIIDRMDEQYRDATDKHSSYTQGEHRRLTEAIQKATL